MMGWPLHKHWFVTGMLIGVAIFFLKFFLTRSG